MYSNRKWICLNIYEHLSNFTDDMDGIETFEVENIEFELSHGKIAAKWWGSKDRRPILMVHGWQDSAG